MLKLIFNSIYFVAWTLILPILAFMSLFITKWRSSLLARLGLMPPEFNSGKVAKLNPIWFHAVSVGELNAIKAILEIFLQEQFLLVSVSTKAAYEMGQIKFENYIKANKMRLIYMPYDHPLIVSLCLAKINPSAIVLTESEIWPALIDQAKNKKIKILSLNAKISDKSFFWYKFLAPIFSPLYKSFNLIIAQSPGHSRKFIELGVGLKQIIMSGNIKFAASPKVKDAYAKQIKQALGYKEENIVLIAASTHEEEEAIIVSIFQELQLQFPFLRLILAPRHPERFSTVNDIIYSAAKLIPIKFSSIKGSLAALLDTKPTSIEKLLELTSTDIPMLCKEANDVLLVDTIGDLANLFSVADIAFIGGTLNSKIGGHNVIEPCAYAVPTVVGPYYQNNRDIVELLEESGNLFVAESKEDLRLEIENLILNPNIRLAKGKSAQEYVQKHANLATEVAQYIKNSVQKVTPKK